MEDAIRRAVERQFPELTGGYHLPRFARVTAVTDAPADAGLCDDFRPRYAVDIVVLGPDDEPDPAMPPLAGVPLPLPTGGEEMGIYAFPGGRHAGSGVLRLRPAEQALHPIDLAAWAEHAEGAER